MKLKNICLGIACIAVVSACSDKMDYHEYTSYDKGYVFSDFSRTAGFVNNIYSYLDTDLPSYQSLASACDEAEMAVTYSSVLDYTNGGWSALNPKSLWGYYSGIRAANFYLAESKDLDFYDLRYAQDYEAQMNRFNRYQYEVRLLRAYYYFLLVRAYGDVPFTVNVLTESEAKFSFHVLRPRKSLILLSTNVKKWRPNCLSLIRHWTMTLPVVPIRRPVVSRKEQLWL